MDIAVIELTNTEYISKLHPILLMIHFIFNKKGHWV